MEQTKFDYIKKKLIDVHSQVTIDKSFNLQDINIRAEDMFMHILNDVYSWELVNANKIRDNFPTVDLIDVKNKKVIQVTSSISTTKINKTLQGIEKFKSDDDLSSYAEYDLIFLYIIEDKKDLSARFKIENELTNDNFLDITDILKVIQGDLDKEIKVFKTLQKIFVGNIDSLDSFVSPNIDKKEILITKDSKKIGIITIQTVPVEFESNNQKKTLNISIYPVTFEEYDLFCEITSRRKLEDEDWGRDRRPVINITLEDVEAYCIWLKELTQISFRIPSSAEWEMIAKLNIENNKLIDYISCKENSHKKTNLVGVREHGKQGIYDMPGNIYEWSNTKENDAFLVKGGSFRNKLDSFNLEKYILVLPFDANDNLGFRILF